MKWLLIAVFATNGIDAQLSPMQQEFQTKEACTQGRIVLAQLALANGVSVVSACVEQKGTAK
ncbi:hypothetical protein UFOVP1326_25 [uncultured Caudovirales phage]|uniref:Uncharacterized protein n=1 Tax=uncultured Caudovirales phage TaxID=2100421 RepID=A0A6J5RXX4_9CAUD|nr:hypothetical protein UFOVP1326_25 [uncultured Caudovirales phage]CAB4212482.1 hypothetical protein UFOVP1436_14 [uncultured Caudovirales phage]